jgi:hypothetical protein
VIGATSSAFHFAETERVAAVHVTYPIPLTRGSGADAPVYDSIRVRYEHLGETRDSSTVPVDYGDDLTVLNDEEGFGPRGSGCLPRDRFFRSGRGRRSLLYGFLSRQRRHVAGTGQAVCGWGGTRPM